MKKKTSEEVAPQPATPGYHNRFGFPYSTTLSFVPLINRLEEKASDPNCAEAAHIIDVIKTVKAIPELMEPIEELSVLNEYRQEVNLLMSTVLPSTVLDGSIVGVIIPFQPVTVFASSKFKEIFPVNDEGIWDITKSGNEKNFSELVAFSGIAILKKYYNYQMTHPDLMKGRKLDRMTDTFTFYMPEINTEFATITALKPPKPLNEIDLSPLNDNFFNTEFWLKNFPPDTFAFEGLAIYRMTDITERELVSQLEYTLLQTTSIVEKESIRDIQDKLRSYFRIPNLRIGIAPMLNYRGQMAACSAKNWNCFVPVEKMELMFENFEESIYGEAIQRGKPYLVSDIDALPQRTPVEEELLKQGIRCVVLVPVFQGQELIGAIEMGTAKPHELNFITLLKLKEILPLFSVAFQRAAKDFENLVQTTIKEHYTSIHPSVEWKFARSVLDMLGTASEEGSGKLVPIEFNDVTPIYGQVDIRGSSEKRNEAIRQDVIRHLSEARNVLLAGYKEFPLHIIDELVFRIDQFQRKLSLTIDSGDETGILDFLKVDVEPILHSLGRRSAPFKKLVDSYFSLLDTSHGFYYEKRREFEESLTAVNDIVSQILEEEESYTQKLLPHYFEKYKTDGVEYNIYLGESILEKGQYDSLYVKSFRLWQLVTMVNIARATHQLKPELPNPLDTTQLILCYSNPFSIMFRMDEKRFDVAGAYNIRYEIVKKRIDKAHIKGTNDRITQPHQIAIIYTQDKEAREYERYFEYLRAKGMIKGEAENLEVEPLQGMQGLKALRITINYESEDPKLEYDDEELFKQMKDVMV